MTNKNYGKTVKKNKESVTKNITRNEFLGKF